MLTLLKYHWKKWKGLEKAPLCHQCLLLYVLISVALLHVGRDPEADIMHEKVAPTFGSLG